MSDRDATGRVVLLTGNGLRHRYVARQFADSLDLVGAAYEQKAKIVAEPERLSQDDQRDIERHLGARDGAERKLLGSDVRPPDTSTLNVEHGQSNSPEVFEWVQSLRPDFIVLYGTSIIKPPLLDHFSDRLVNIHLGLSPYYRGTATNFWPLVDGRPEFVGATLHVVAAKVDAGPILAQVRPAAEPSDRAHELGTKTIMAAAELMPRVLSALRRGHARPHVQDLTQGKVCRRRDFTADAVRQMWRNFERGMMDEYLAEVDERQAASPIVELDDSL